VDLTGLIKTKAHPRNVLAERLLYKGGTNRLCTQSVFQKCRFATLTILYKECRYYK
jgi:hypothetical protein